MRPKSKEQGNRPPLRPLILILAAAALLAAAVGSLAWFRFIRSLRTYTKLQMPILSIVGKDPASMIVNLGDIDVENEASPKRFEFGVQSSMDAAYWLRLAHTTNIGLNYSIYHANANFTPGARLAGNYLNLASSDPPLANASGSYHDITYGDYTSVQKNAEPLYWQSAQLDIQKDIIQYFILEVSWDSSIINNKETDMVYLTASTSGPQNGGTP